MTETVEEQEKDEIVREVLKKNILTVDNILDAVKACGKCDSYILYLSQSQFSTLADKELIPPNVHLEVVE